MARIGCKRNMERQDINILIACEESQVEVTAFRAAGFNAFSCDILPCSGCHPEWHLHGSALGYLYFPGDMFTQDGSRHYVERWHVVIGHPPCTYLTRVGAVHLYRNGEVNEVRLGKLMEGRNFFLHILNAPALMVCVENPIPLRAARLPRPTCYVQPSDYGAPFTKKTCYWLRNLPPLMAGCSHPNPQQYLLHCSSGRRSKSFPQVAAAMVQQWAPIIEAEAH